MSLLHLVQTMCPYMASLWGWNEDLEMPKINASTYQRKWWCCQKRLKDNVDEFPKGKM